MTDSPRFAKAEAIVDFPKAEEKVRAFWKDRHIFEKSVEMREGRETFIWGDGPPTANGKPHNGHVLTRVFKDIFPRYRTMRGFYAERKAGWDTHGLPVEVEVEKELGIHGKAAIEAYGVEAFIQRCMDSVFRYTKEWERMTEQMGHWVDLSDAYVTYHKSYVESVWWALAQLFEKNLLYKGHKVLWWWAQGGTALSSAEVGLGYKTVDDPSVYVAFPLVDEPDTSLLIWTTTPWTLPSNMYAAVKPDIDYVVVENEDDDRKFIVAAALRESIAGKLGRDLPVVRELKGEALVGKRYRPPFDDYYERYGAREVASKRSGTVPMFWKVLAAGFVELDQGTGLVHEAPAFGEVDYDLHRAIVAGYEDPSAVPLLCAIGPDGKFTDEVPSLTGLWVKDADKQIIRTLKERGSLLHHETLRHEYPFCWRADDDPLIQFARPAWFIRTTALIDRAIANNRAVNWVPEHIKEGRFGDFLANNVDWALSRERYWGTPLNIWVNDVTGKMIAPTSVDEILRKNPDAFQSFEEAKKKNPGLSEHLLVHKPWIDDVTFTEPDEEGVYRRVPEVIDCWFDSGSMPFAQWGYPHDGHEKFKETFPADYIVEAIDQTRGWFYSMLMISTLVFEHDYPHPYKTCMVLGHVSDKEGRKESKSKGNFTPPEVILEKVAMDFAVIDAKDVHAKDGVALIAREDLEGLDLNPGAAVVVGGIDLRLEAAKGLPRRVVVLPDDVRNKLGVSAAERGLAILPAHVPGLPENHRVTLEDPNTPAPGADAFRWFFLAANPPWGSKRHSLGNVRASQKEFPIKLRNVYSFFTIYANIDSFDPAKEKGRPVRERALLDRFILSELAKLNASLIEHLDAYRAYEAARELTDFVDALSNWYLRRSRSRFWGSERNDDKIDAYATLYEALVTVTKLAAPFVPFMTEEIYQNLVRGPFGPFEPFEPFEEDAPESVHLCDYPEPDSTRVDALLNEDMAVVRSIVSLGLRVRTDNRLKVRQPLLQAEVTLSHPELDERIRVYGDLIAEELNVQEVVFVHGALEHVEYLVKPNFRNLGPKVGKKMPAVKAALAAADGSALRAAILDTGKAEIDVDGETLSLNLEDVEVGVQAKEGYAAAGDQAAVVVLATELTPELLEEGKYRELLSRIQAFRKNLGLEYTQRIRLALDGPDAFRAIVGSRREHFLEETLCVDLKDALEDGTAREVEIDGEKMTIWLSKA